MNLALHFLSVSQLSWTRLFLKSKTNGENTDDLQETYAHRYC